MTRSIVYLRQSKDVEGTGAAVDRQLQGCLQLIERRGWGDPVKVITDNNVSATVEKVRPGFRELLRDIDAGACEWIVAWDLDRLTRKPLDTAELMETCLRRRVSIATVQLDYDVTTPSGEFFLSVRAAQARQEVRQKSERQRAQARQAAERGLPPTRRAFGYEQDGMTVNEPEAAVLRDAYAALLRGESLVSIVRRMNATGKLTTRGTPWHRKTIRSVLMNPRYIAIRTHRGKEVGPGTWPPLIGEGDWHKAVALLTDPARKDNHHGTARRWIGGGLFRCGRCGSDVRVGYRRNHTRIYVCRASDHLARVSEPIDELVNAVMEARLAMPDVAELLDDGDEEVAALRAEAAALTRRLDQARDRLDRGVLDEEDYVATKRTIRAEQDVIQRKITSAARTSQLVQLASAADPVAAWRGLDLAARRAVIDALATVTLLPGRFGKFDPGTVRIEWRV